jgi:cytochrome-b5 reductase
MNCAV